MEGVDYSFAKPDPGCMASNGKHFAVRYIGTSSSKCLTVNEYNALVANGIDLVAVYQTTADFMLKGRIEGVMAAQRSLSDLEKFGAAGAPVYFALDRDPRGLVLNQWHAIHAFLEGAASVIGKARVGVYAGYLGIERLVPTHAAWGWQTYAWSGGQISSSAHLYQYRNGVGLCGGTVDLCRNLKSDFGQWSKTLEEEDVANTKAEIQSWVREVMDEGTVFGELTWAGTNESMAKRIMKLVDEEEQTQDQIEQIRNMLLGLHNTVSDSIKASIDESLDVELSDEVKDAVFGAIDLGVDSSIRRVLGSLDVPATPEDNPQPSDG